MNKRLFHVLSAILLAAMLLSACAPQPTQAPAPAEATEAPQPEAPEATEAPAEPAAAEELLLGYVMHVPVPFTDAIRRGAEQAGKDFGVKVEVVVPTQFDPEQGVALFEGLQAKGTKDIAVIPQGEIWVKAINDAAAKGYHVNTANVTAPGSEALAFYGEASYSNGQLLGNATADILKERGITSGKVMPGLCVPGIGVLVDRYNGFVDAMKAAFPDGGFEYSDMLDVTSEAGTNYTAWENILSANPDMAVAVGLCSIDIPNLARLKDKTGEDFVIVGEDLVPESLDAIKAGLADATVGQHPYLQGYLPILSYINHYVKGEDWVEGFVNVTNEVVTAENVDDLYARETDVAAELAWYKDFIAQNFSDLSGVALPIECASGIPGESCK